MRGIEAILVTSIPVKILILALVFVHKNVLLVKKRVPNWSAVSNFNTAKEIQYVWYGALQIA